MKYLFLFIALLFLYMQALYNLPDNAFVLSLGIWSAGFFGGLAVTLEKK